MVFTALLLNADIIPELRPAGYDAYHQEVYSVPGGEGKRFLRADDFNEQIHVVPDEAGRGHLEAGRVLRMFKRIRVEGDLLQRDAVMK